MIVEAIKDGDRYILPIKGKKERIKVYIDEEQEGIDLEDLFRSMVKNNKYKDLSKDEIREMVGEELYRKYLLLDEKTMEEEWQFLVMTEKDWGDGYEEMEEAIEYWNKED